MCWRSDNAIPECKIAEEDFEVFKVVRGKYIDPLKQWVRSYHKDFVYRLGEVYKMPSLKLYNLTKYPDLFWIEEGFHSYSTKCTVNIEARVMYLVYNKTYYLGRYADGVVVKGYIPKGATYYLNNRGECVSDSIVLTEINEQYVLDSSKTPST